jgi:hypothetical protein
MALARLVSRLGLASRPEWEDANPSTWCRDNSNGGLADRFLDQFLDFGPMGLVLKHFPSGRIVRRSHQTNPSAGRWGNVAP